MLWQTMVERPNCRTELSQCWQHAYKRGQSIPLHNSQWKIRKFIYSNWLTYKSDDTRGDATDFDKMLLWLREILWNFYCNQAICDFIKHTKAGIGPPLIQRPPTLLLRHLRNITVRGLVIYGPANSSPLDHFYFLNKSLRVWTPYGGAIFKLWVHNSLICSPTDTFMFCFTISFDAAK